MWLSGIFARAQAAARWAGPLRFTAYALSGSDSALSTAVYAAALTTTSNASGLITASIALALVMSNSARSVTTAITPNFSARRMSSQPTWPLAPVTNILGCSADMGINPYISAGAPNQYRRAAN